MKVVRLEAENFKRLQAVQIDPAGNTVVISGKNGSGKSSVLDAIYVALVGRSAAPPRPIRKGECECRIKLDLGDLVVTRRFTAKDGEEFTDSLKVENDQGLRYSRPQQVLDALLGEIGFDPFAFVGMKPDKQAETLLAMVPLPVDLDELAEADSSDRMKRRDINRDIAALEGQLAGIPKEDVPENLPDRAALLEELARAGDTNSAIERERLRREDEARTADRLDDSAANMRRNAKERREEAAQLIAEADSLERDAAESERKAAARRGAVEALPPLDAPADTVALQEKVREADAAQALIDRQTRRSDLVARLEVMREESKGYTVGLEARDQQRRSALAKAKMPIDGLAFEVTESGKPLVMLGGVPFEQASTAEQLRASTAIAMAANPTLRVLRITDGALLDDDSMALLRKLAAAEDYQLWIEVVRPTEGVGIVIVVMENGAVKGADSQAESDGKPKPKKAKADAAPEPGKLV